MFTTCTPVARFLACSACCRRAGVLVPAAARAGGRHDLKAADLCVSRDRGQATDRECGRRQQFPDGFEFFGRHVGFTPL